MRPYALVYDNVLACPWALRDYAIRLPYADLPAPDGVTYPNISLDVPDALRAEVQSILDRVLGPVIINYLFFRLSLPNVEPPHWAHTDGPFGTHEAVIYLTAPVDCQGGIPILEHVSGALPREPSTMEQLQVWQRDTADRSKWDVKMFIPMVFNRMVILDSSLFHAASGVFGTSPVDGRLVLVSLITRKET